MVDLDYNKNYINIGRRGENLARSIEFNLTKFIEDYGEGSAVLVYKRSRDNTPYIVPSIKRYGPVLTWNVTNVDTAYVGVGEGEIRWYADDILAKSFKFSVVVSDALEGTDVTPDPYKDWIDEANALLYDAKYTLPVKIQKLSADIADLESRFGTIDDIVGDAIEELEEKRDAVLQDIPEGYTQMSEEVNTAITDFDTRIDEAIALVNEPVTDNTEIAFQEPTRTLHVAAASDLEVLEDRVDELNDDLVELDSRLSESIDEISERLTLYDETEETSFLTFDFNNKKNVDLFSSGSVSVAGSNLFSNLFEVGKAYANGAELTIVSKDSFTIKATESRRYNRVWFIIPNGKALIGKYVSFKSGTPTSQLPNDLTFGLAWVKGSTFQSSIVSAKQSTNWEYNNKLIASPSDPTSDLAFYIDICGTTFSTVGDITVIPNAQVNIGTTVAEYESYDGIVLNGNSENVNSNGVKTLFSENVFHLTYFNEIDVANSLKPLFNKKVLIIGDSISTGPSSAKRIQGTNYENYDKWVDILINKGHLKNDNVYNSSIHASGFVAENSNYPNMNFMDRLQAIDNKDTFDYVIVFGGINDFIQSVNWNDFTNAVDNFMSYLVNNYTQARIIVISPLRNWNTGMNGVQKYVVDYSDYIRSSAKSLCIPVIDATVESGFCPFNQTFRSRWTNIPSSGSGAGTPDGLHPNAEYMEKFLAEYILKNIMRFTIS